MYPPVATAHFRPNWDEVRAHGRVVHLLACGGTGYSDLAQVAQGDVAVIVAAIAFESDDRTDYSVLPLSTVRDRLLSLLEHLPLRSFHEGGVEAANGSTAGTAMSPSHLLTFSPADRAL